MNALRESRAAQPGPDELVVLSRRRFLVTGGSALLVAGSTLGACASVAVRQVHPVNGKIALPLAEHPELLQPGGAVRLQVSGDEAPLYVLVTGERAFAVLSPICTHLGCTVDIQGAWLVCPCHGSTYERTGRVVRGPAERALRRYGASVVGGELVIDLGAAVPDNG